MQHTGYSKLLWGPRAIHFWKAVFMGNTFPLTVRLYLEPF